MFLFPLNFIHGIPLPVFGLLGLITSHPKIVEASRSCCYEESSSCKDKEHFIELLTIPATSCGDYVRLHVSMTQSLRLKEKANPRNMSNIPPVAFLLLP
jgi:hypothetical protein